MLEEIKKEEIPQEVLDKFHDSEFMTDAIKFYKCNSMFGTHHTDYLLVISENKNLDGFYCYGYVYNGNAPECSEFGSFGINKLRTKRIW